MEEESTGGTCSARTPVPARCGCRGEAVPGLSLACCGEIGTARHGMAAGQTLTFRMGAAARGEPVPRLARRLQAGRAGPCPGAVATFSIWTAVRGWAGPSRTGGAGGGGRGAARGSGERGTAAALAGAGGVEWRVFKGKRTPLRGLPGCGGSPGPIALPDAGGQSA